LRRAVYGHLARFRAVPSHSVPQEPSRRALLRAAALGAVAAGAAGWGGNPGRPLPVDPLIAQETQARADAASAVASSPVLPERSEALRVIAAERTQHANALRTEIDRRLGVFEDGTRPAAESATTGVPVPTAVPAL